MEIWLYLAREPQLWGMKIKPEKELNNHFTGLWREYKILWPKQLETDIISPEIFTKLKIKLGLKRLLLLDRIKNSTEPTYIKDHINISGINYLRERTPHKDLPTFPDMSNIYEIPQGESGAALKCVGGRRFSENFSETNSIIGEWSGLISTVWNYVGVKITAVGVPLDFKTENLIIYFNKDSSPTKRKEKK